jgi:hypothetical protein
MQLHARRCGLRFCGRVAVQKVYNPPTCRHLSWLKPDIFPIDHGRLIQLEQLRHVFLHPSEHKPARPCGVTQGLGFKIIFIANQ